MDDLMRTLWKHKKKGGLYRVTDKRVHLGGDEVYLSAVTKGRRSTWKAECLLPFDYDLVAKGAEKE